MKVLISREIAAQFSSATGIEAVSLPPYNKLDLPVQCHADMLFCVLDNKIFCYEEYVHLYDLLPTLAGQGYEVNFVEKGCDTKYPDDISLNVLVMGKTIFCNKAYTAQEILEHASENGYTVVNVKQGYAACSTLVLDENTAITADRGVCDAIKRQGKECLLVDGDDITLSGYSCGFFGGASGVIGNNVYFFGDISGLKSGNEILDFLHRKNRAVFSISSGRVCDFGGFKVI